LPARIPSDKDCSLEGQHYSHIGENLFEFQDLAMGMATKCCVKKSATMNLNLKGENEE